MIAPRLHELIEGEAVTGEVVRLPIPGWHLGNSLIMRVYGEVIAIPATGRRGHVVLERLLVERDIRPGDHITVIYGGRRTTVDGLRTYRTYRLEGASRAA